MERFSCYKVECSHLSFPTFKQYLNHIRNSYSFKPNFQITCTVPARCYQTFKCFHCSLLICITIGDDGKSLPNADEEREDDNTTDVADPELEETATGNLFLSTLKMQETRVLTDAVTSYIVSHVKDVVAQNVAHLKERVQRCLNEEGTTITEVKDLEDVFNTPFPLESAFKRLKTVRQRTEYAISNLNMVVSFLQELFLPMSLCVVKTDF